jgi:small conductance mechanosensitive channel
MNFNLSTAVEKVFDKLESWFETFVGMLPNMVMAIVLFIVFIFLARIIQRLFARIIRRATDDLAIRSLLTQLMYYIVLGVGFFIILEVLNLDKAVTSLLAGVGVLGIALGFAFQDIAANFVSGVILAFKKPFNIGDVVEVDGTMGSVEKNDFRVTTIRTFQGQEVYIPNKDLLQKKITNYTVTGERRIDLKIGISYGEDLEHVRTVTLETLKSVEGVRTDKDLIFDYAAFGDSSINFNLRFWIHFPGEPGLLDIVNNVFMALKKTYDREGITIPFPIRTLDFGIKGGQKLSELGLFNGTSEGEKKN